jgi:hypothetical protein
MKRYSIQSPLRQFVITVLTGCCALMLCSLNASAQQGKGTISGTVTDQSGAVVPGATVTVTNTGTNAAFTAVTNEEGFYTAPGLPIGNYNVTVARDGFKRAVRSGVTLQVDQKAQVDVVMTLGEVSEAVEVTAQAPLTETGSATVGKVIENRRMVELPINGRNALALVMLTPSVKSNAGPTNSGFGDRGLQISNISINGGPNSMNGNTIDGGTNIQAFVGEVNISPSVDAISEFKVQSSVMSAEFGFTAGGVVNIVTKSGTNQYHGTAYEFLRNDAFDARNAFASTRTKLRYNQFGASLGGPVIRNQTFFFGNWEEYRLRRAFPLITSVPTEKMRQGDFSELRDTSGRLIPIYDPATTRANPNGSGFIRDQFSCNGRLNVICPDRLDPVALNIQKFYPLPNRAPTDPFTNSNNYENQAGSTRDMRQYTVKLDHQLTKKNTLTGRYAYYGHLVDDASAGPIVWPDPVISKRDDDLRNHNFLLSDTHAFSPTLLNEFRASLAMSRFDFVVRSAGGGWPRKLGLPANVPDDQFPQISNGLAGFQGANIGYRHSLAWSFFDALTMIRENHTLKFGADYRINLGFQNQKGPTSGAYNFAAGLTGNPQNPTGTGWSYATFLAGAVSSATITTHLGQTQRNFSTSFFFQDDWKATRRLTLNLGLRYDFQQQPYEVNNGVSSFDPFTTDPVSGLLGRTVFAGVNGQPRAFRRNDYNDFGPRFGFAYDVFGDGRTVVRGGYAIFYPYLFIRQTHGNTAGFASTTTTYNPPGNNTNLPAFQLRNGLPTPPIQPLGAALGPGAFLGQNVSYDEPDGTSPYSQQYSLTVQQQVAGNWLFDVTYSANLGHHFIAGGYDLNQLDPKHLALGLALQDRVANPYAGRVPGALGAATITRGQLLRPYPYYNNITVRNPRLGNYNYHSLLVSAEKRLARGLTFLFSYTAGKLISDSVVAPVDFGGVEQVQETGYQNGKFDRAAERSVDPSDVSQRAVISAVYELPFGAGRRWRAENRIVNGVIGGWQVNTVGTMQTGLPIIVRGANNNAANRPNVVGGAKLDNPTRERWFDPSVFVNPAPFTFGNVGRVLPDVRGPGTVNWDLSLIKNTKLGERLTLQFRAEAFNFLNHVNLLPPTSDPRFGVAQFVPGPDGRNRSGTFGVITAARDARIMQFALKLIF